MILVGGVPVAVVDVVDVVAVRDGDVPAALLVAVAVTLVRGVAVAGALVRVTVVGAVDVAVVHVVDVVAVRDGDVPAAFVVPVVVALVGAVLGGGRHDVLPVPFGRATARRRRPLPRYRFTVERRPSPRTRSEDLGFPRRPPPLTFLPRTRREVRADRAATRVTSCRCDHA
ncbi:hypothetical protein GCM10010340_37930 [Streptomyces griseoloalbus]|nr:hypothetical protein GCM10010340_37930 [Streptomyces albaduncus]